MIDTFIKTFLLPLFQQNGDKYRIPSDWVIDQGMKQYKKEFHVALEKYGLTTNAGFIEKAPKMEM